MFGFTEGDLKSNKRGLLSQRQQEWLGMTARYSQLFKVCYCKSGMYELVLSYEQVES